jgi:hypothetical protein
VIFGERAAEDFEAPAASGVTELLLVLGAGENGGEERTAAGEFGLFKRRSVASRAAAATRDNAGRKVSTAVGERRGDLRCPMATALTSVGEKTPLDASGESSPILPEPHSCTAACEDERARGALAGDRVSSAPPDSVAASGIGAIDA